MNDADFKRLDLSKFHTLTNHAPAKAFSSERAAQVYATRRESVVGHVTAKQTDAGGPAFGSEAHVAAVYTKREQASGGRHPASTQRG
jgi:hypothetical protein